MEGIKSKNLLTKRLIKKTENKPIKNNKKNTENSQSVQYVETFCLFSTFYPINKDKENKWKFLNPIEHSKRKKFSWVKKKQNNQCCKCSDPKVFFVLIKTKNKKNPKMKIIRTNIIMNMKNKISRKKK